MLSFSFLFSLLRICVCNLGDISECIHACVENDSYCLPRTIWSYWDNNIPEDIQEIMDVKKKSLSNFTFCFLSEKNLSCVLNTREFPEGFNKLWPSGKADFIRVCLLEKFGGIWIDSGVLVNSGDKMESIFSETFQGKSQLVGFGEKKQVQAGLFGAPKYSDFMKRLKTEMYAMVKMGAKEFCNRTCAELKSKFKFNPGINCRPYWVLDLVMQKTCLENSTLCSKVLRLSRNHSPFHLHHLCRWSLKCVRYRLLHDKEVRNIPFIAIGHRIRNGKKVHLEDNRYLSSISHKKWKSINRKIIAGNRR